jgi:signal transduction histidine kinase
MISFENKYYQIDNFLSDVLSKNNLKEIENQLKLAQMRKNTSILILIISLLSSIVLGVAITYIVYKSLKEEREHRELLVQRMIRIEEQERKNLSRQIHDQLSQDLGALKIYLELIGKEIRGDKEHEERIEKSKKILSSLIEKSHNISQLLRPPQLDELGLVESIEVLVSEYKEITNCNYTYYKPEQEINLAPEYSLALYRIVQEALTNIAKHAFAKNVVISLHKEAEYVSLCIEDDGVGFDYQEYLKRPRRRKEDKFGLGLQGLRERIELLGGKFIIDTAPNKGTKIKVELTISNATKQV